MYLSLLLLGPGNWAEWDDFSPCTAACGGGNKTRGRECVDLVTGKQVEDCPNFETTAVETVPCNTESCKNIYLQQLIDVASF
jgi:hypothetical protein